MAVTKINLSQVAEALGLPDTASEEDVLQTARALRETANDSAKRDTGGPARDALRSIATQLLQRRDRARANSNQAFADMTDLAEQAEAAANV
jgi:hypothetical protein